MTDNTPTPQAGEKLVERAMDGFVWTPERKAEIEVIMKQWDAMAGYLKRGVHGSLPSDWFYDKAEDLVFLRSSLQEALERAEKAEALNAILMGDDENQPRYTTKRLKQEIARANEKADGQYNELSRKYVAVQIERNTSQAEVVKLRAALEPFSAWSARELDKSIPRNIQEDDSTPVLGSGELYENADAVVVTVGDLRCARAALGKGGE